MPSESTADHAAGVYIHAGKANETSTSYFENDGSGSSSIVVSHWNRGIACSQMRTFVAHDHNNAGTTIAYKDTSEVSPSGMSAADKQLVSHYNTGEIRYKLAFEKVDSSWYKMTIYNNKIWGDVNYNATSGSNAYTFIKASDIGVDSNGKVYVTFWGMQTSGLSYHVYEVSNYKDSAENWASSFLTQTSTVCNGAGDKKTGLEAIWTSLGTSYNALSQQSKDILVAASASEAGSIVEQAVARYDQVVRKYSLTDFMGRVSETNISSLINNASSIVLISVCSLVLALSAGAIILKKKKEVR